MRVKKNNKNCIKYSKQLARRYPSDRFSAFGKCIKIQIPFGVLTELKVDDVKYGLAHLCEHLFSHVVFNKNICKFDSSFIQYDFTWHNLSYNNEKELKLIISKLRKLINNFNISNEVLEKEKEILKSEFLCSYNLRDSIETIHNLAVYGKVHSPFGTGNSIDSITKEDVIKFIKKYYRFLEYRADQIFSHKYTKFVKTKYRHIVTEYTHSDLLINKIHKEGDTHKLWVYGIHKGYSSIVTDLFQQVLYETRNRYESFIGNQSVKINGEYQNIYYTVSDIDFDIELFKSKVLIKAHKLKNKELKRKVLRFFNNDSFIYL